LKASGDALSRNKGEIEMSQDSEQSDITKKKVVHEIPGMDTVVIRRDAEYRAGDPDALTMEIYYPPDFQSGARFPAVVFVFGYPDPVFHRMLGCKQKDMESYVTWARLAAASGIVAITYSNRQPADDIEAVLEYVRQNAEALGIDESRIGIWAASGHGPLALWVLMDERHRDSLKCAVLCYCFTLDLDGSTAVAEAVAKWGFVNPCAGKSVEDLSPNVPLFLARAGQDQFPGLNEAMDRFVAGALTRNLPITLVNHASGPHAFDLLDASETSREIIKQILAFMQFHLSPR
jgi:hypothetical protein